MRTVSFVCILLESNFNIHRSEGAEGCVYFCRKKHADGHLSAERFAAKVCHSYLPSLLHHCSAGLQIQRQERLRENEEASYCHGSYWPLQYS
jgi:predicted HD phosphohydrolase